eukprot:SAG31_NODE_1970_length_6766_cov_88.154792_4_plen_207_part_00
MRARDGIREGEFCRLRLTCSSAAVTRLRSCRSRCESPLHWTFCSASCTHSHTMARINSKRPSTGKNHSVPRVLVVVPAKMAELHHGTEAKVVFATSAPGEPQPPRPQTRALSPVARRHNRRGRGCRDRPKCQEETRNKRIRDRLWGGTFRNSRCSRAIGVVSVGVGWFRLGLASAEVSALDSSSSSSSSLSCGPDAAGGGCRREAR